MLTEVIIWIVFVWLAIPVAYFLVFATASLRRLPHGESSCEHHRRTVILIPAYHSDSCIADTVQSALDQDYPSELFSVLVISDGMEQSTIQRLESAGAKVLEVHFENSTKAKSLQQAVRFLGADAFDVAVILDADNIVGRDFLSRTDSAMDDGTRAVQAHRKAKNTDTPVAVIDAVSEEINNSIFRHGHNALGVSSALIGSGMAFEYAWLCANADRFTTAGEDKEMELKLLEDGIFVKYLPDVEVLDEKTRTGQNYYNQRRRWIASQYHLFGNAMRRFSQVRDKSGYLDKLFQWMLPPRMIVIGLVPLITLLLVIFKCSSWPAWLVLTVFLVIAMLLAVPAKMLDGKLLRALLKVPVLAAMSVANLFRIKGTKDRFIHTRHQ